MSVQWDDLKTVAALVRGGSLTAAAAELGVTYTTVARRVARLEAALGQSLFDRTPDGYRANEIALTVSSYAGRMQDETHGLMRALTSRDQSLTGTLTITAPQLVIAFALAPTLSAFRKAHPEVTLRVRATNDLLDLSRREADLAIRVSRSPGDDLKGLRVLPQETGCFGTQDWADRIALDPEGRVDWIVYSEPGKVPAQALERAPGSRVHLAFDDMMAMLGAAAAGLGVVRMPYFLGRAVPGLVSIPLLDASPYADIWVVAHRDVWSSAKVAAFRETLVPAMRAERARFVAG